MRTALRMALRPRVVSSVTALGLLMALLSGLVENPPGASIVGYAYYGHPLVWRVTRTSMPTEVRPVPLGLDVAFWAAATLALLVVLQAAALRWRRRALPGTGMLLTGVGAVLVALAVDLVHELGHAVWGTLAGGTLQSLQVGWFELYPAPGLRSPFRLGLAVVTGLPSESARGLFLLGGSLTTNVLAWALGLLLWGLALGPRARVGAWIAGLLGLLDLPFYVLLPQVGLRHWILLDGETAEPLLGARALGVPDLLFYALTALTTAALVSLYARLHPLHAVRSLPSWDREPSR